MTVSCNICRGPFGDPDELEAHIAADHFSFLPYECEKCPYTKFPTETTIRHHCENLHNQTDYAVRYRISPELLRKRRDVQGALRESLSPAPQGARAEDTNTTATTGQASPVAEGELKVEPTSDQEGVTALDNGPHTSGFDAYSTFDSTQLSRTTDLILQKIDFPEEEPEFSNEQTASTSADAAEMSMEVADSSTPSTSTANLWKALHRATYKPPRRPPTYKPAAKPEPHTFMTSRGNPAVPMGGHLMIQHKPSSDGKQMYWRCKDAFKYKCKARGLSLVGSIDIREKAPHNAHLPSTDLVNSNCLHPSQLYSA